jgi:hypothetical protein
MAEPDETTDDTDEEVEETDAEETTDDSETSDEWKPPTKEEWQKSERALKRAKDESAKRRIELAKLKKEAQSAASSGDMGEAAALREQISEVRQELADNKAIAAILKAGYNGDQPEKMIKLIDFDDIEGSLDDLKDEFPEKFGRQKPPAGRASTGRGRADDAPTDDVDTRFAKRLLRQR